jgi:hypothetical protein
MPEKAKYKGGHTAMGKGEQNASNVKQLRSERRQYWRSQVKRWKESGLTQKEYCIKQDISLDRFGTWKRRLQRENQDGVRSLVAVPAKIVSSAMFT